MKEKYVSETAFRKMMTQKLKKIPLSKWFSIQQVAIRGTPDIIGCIRSIFIALELKKEASSVRAAIQTVNLMQINLSGGIGIFCHPGNANDTLELLTKISKGEGIDRTILQRITQSSVLPGPGKARIERRDP